MIYPWMSGAIRPYVVFVPAGNSALIVLQNGKSWTDEQRKPLLQGDDRGRLSSVCDWWVRG